MASVHSLKTRFTPVLAGLAVLTCLFLLPQGAALAQDHGAQDQAAHAEDHGEAHGDTHGEEHAGGHHGPSPTGLLPLWSAIPFAG
nr:hypothetical protein [Candidatus Krumholzibacteria bacterium]